MHNIDGTREINEIHDPWQPVIQVDFDFEKLAALGIDWKKASQTVDKYFNEQGPYYQYRKHNFDINDLSMFPIANKNGDLIPLSSIAEFRHTSLPGCINHYNGTRSLILSLVYTKY